MKGYKSLILILLLSNYCKAQILQTATKTGKENMPPTIAAERSWWNLLKYTIEITPDYNQKTIKGTNQILFDALQKGSGLQLDLQDPMQIDRVVWNNMTLGIRKDKQGRYLIFFPRAINKGSVQSITVHFHGKPQAALKPPFDNGWIWTKDLRGRPWMSIACEGSGPSIWLPCKDVMYDEPDQGVVFSITVPDTLTAVANGRLQSVSANEKGKKTFTWQVVNPINGYNIIPYIGSYESWDKKYTGLKGILDRQFWVLDYNLDKGKQHFQQTDTMLRAFEYWLGPYPFYEDSYKLVEAPMPGMEHQSAIAYGNGFQNGYQGKDFISHSGWGLKWDFMLVHESGHEWFGNSITASYNGESWIHEGFTKYLETLYTDYVFGTEAGDDYAIGTWQRIKNDAPVLSGNSSDYYYKGSAMLHMIRQIAGDTIFRKILTGLNKTFYHQTISTQQILAFFNQCGQRDFTKIFEQYLQTTQIPVLEYFINNNELRYRWTNCVDGFDMPVKVWLGKIDNYFITPGKEWQILKMSSKQTTNFYIDRNFYIKSKNTEGK